MHDDTCRLAQNLARNCGYAVFPCRSNKHPATPGGGNGGFHFASTDLEAIRDLWRQYPGPLIGVRTGITQSVLDVDPDGWPWFRDNEHRLPETRTFQTPRGGAHLWFQHPPGLRISQSLIAPGIDVRAEGGYVIHWFAAGLPCTDHSPPAPWPEWLLEAATRPEPPPPEPIPLTQQTGQFGRYEALVRKLLANIGVAPLGLKHDVLLRSSRTLGGVLQHLGWSEETAVRHLVNALPRSGPNRCLDWKLAERTARAGLQHGTSNPITLADRPYNREQAA